MRSRKPGEKAVSFLENDLESILKWSQLAVKVTVYLQMDNFLQIWNFGSKYRSKCDL